MLRTRYAHIGRGVGRYPPTSAAGDCDLDREISISRSGMSGTSSSGCEPSRPLNDEHPGGTPAARASPRGPPERGEARAGGAPPDASVCAARRWRSGARAAAVRPCRPCRHRQGGAGCHVSSSGG